MAHIFKSTTREAEAGEESVSSKPVWSIHQDPGQPGLCRKSLKKRKGKGKKTKRLKFYSFLCMGVLSSCISTHHIHAVVMEEKG